MEDRRSWRRTEREGGEENSDASVSVGSMGLKPQPDRPLVERKANFFGVHDTVQPSANAVKHVFSSLSLSLSFPSSLRLSLVRWIKYNVSLSPETQTDTISLVLQQSFDDMIHSEMTEIGVGLRVKRSRGQLEDRDDER